MKQYSYIIETLVSLTVLILINLIWYRDNLGFLGISPHPYWIVVIGISVKYELKQSLVTSFISSLTYSIFLFVSHNITLAEYFEFETFKPILLFVIFSILIGKVRTGQVAKLNEVKKKKESLEKKISRLQGRNDKISQINNELSDRIIHHSFSYSTIYEMAKKMRTLNIEDLYPAALNFISEAIEVEKCSFYVCNNGQLELVSTRGWDEQDENKRSLINSNKLVEQVLKNKETRAVHDFLAHIEEETPLSIEDEVIISIPITYGLDKRVFGIINIEKIPFNRFNSDSISLLNIVSAWISDSLDEEYEAKKSIKLDQNPDFSGHRLNCGSQEEFKSVSNG